MKKSKKDLLVRKIEEGVVVDHIPSRNAPLVLKLLNPHPSDRVVIIKNAKSSKLEKKDLIKIEGKYLTSKETDLISLVAPAATVNIIDNWEIKKKKKVELPEQINGIFKCPNLACPTNREDYPNQPTFRVLKNIQERGKILQCMKCNSYLYDGTIRNYIKSNDFTIEGGGLASKKKIEHMFLKILLKNNALRIASDSENLFILKSGRRSPYFINLATLTGGESLSKLKWVVASYIKLLLDEEEIKDFDYIFGPAYKGISLATLACEGLNSLFEMDKKYLYDRKEGKEYGDTSADKVIVGAKDFEPGGRILMIDDTVTTGKTKKDSIEKLNMLGENEIVGLIITVDRQEKRGSTDNIGKETAVQHLSDEFNFNIHSILNMQTIYQQIKDDLSNEIRNLWKEYFRKYGSVENL